MLKTHQAIREGSVTVDSWNDILFLIKEPDRHGQTVWNVRLVLGSLPPWRYGTFETEEAAHEAFAKIIEFVDRWLAEMFCEAGNRANCDSNEEY